MRANLLLLLTVAIVAILVVGFLLFSNRNGEQVVIQDIQERFAVVPNQPNPNAPPIQNRVGTGVNEYNYDLPAPQTQPDSSNNNLAAKPAETTTNPSTSTTTNPSADSETPATAKASPAAGSFDKKGEVVLTNELSKNGPRKNSESVILVDKGSHFTYVLQKQGDKVVIVYRASNAVGGADTPSPPGPYKIAQLTKWPSWVPPKSIDPQQKAVQPYNKDRSNPLGVARIRLDKFQLSLHGTNDPKSIRTDASHGCIRHSNNDIMKVFGMVEEGDHVIITEKFVGTKLTDDMFQDKQS